MHLFLAQTAQKPPMGAHLIFIGLIFLIFYLLIIKPQKQKQADHQKMMGAIKKNDEVITIGGIYGTVVNVKEKSVVLRIADNVKVELKKNAIAGLKKDKPDVAVEPQNDGKR